MRLWVFLLALWVASPAKALSSGDYLVGTIAELNGDVGTQLAAYDKLIGDTPSQELLKKGFVIYVFSQMSELVADKIYPHLDEQNLKAEVKFVTAVVEHKRGKVEPINILNIPEDDTPLLRVLASLMDKNGEQITTIKGLPIDALRAERDNKHEEAARLWKKHYLEQPYYLNRLIWYVQARKRGGLEVEEITTAPELAEIYQLPPLAGYSNRALTMLMVELAQLSATDNYSSAIYSSLGLYLEPDNKHLALLLGRSLYLAGLRNWSENEIYPRLLGSVAYSPIWDKHLVVVYAHILENKQLVENLYLEYLSRHPKEELVLIQLGRLYSSQDSYSKAFSVYDKILQQNPSNVDALYLRGMTSERLGNWKNAEPDLKKALELNPDDPRIINYLAYSWLDRGENLPQALELLKTAYDKMGEQDGYIADSYGWALYKNGNPQMALEYLQQASDQLPNDAVVNEHLADVLNALGKTNLARLSYHRALQSDPDKKAAERISSKLESL